MIRSLRLAELRIPFKVAFRHASAERHETSSLWVEAASERGAFGYGESCPREYVTGETIDTARAFFSSREDSWRDEIVDLPSLRAWMATHAEDVDANPAAWCAVELALLDLLAREQGLTVEALLALPPLSGRFHYSAVLGDADIESFQSMAERYRRQGFGDFKVKLSGNLKRDQEKMAVLSRSDGAPLRIRVDANNLWESADEAIAFLKALDCRFFAVEEPIRPNRYADLARIGAAMNCQIVLDESFLRLTQIALLGNTPASWIINVRVSKMGGLLRSLAIVEAAIGSGVSLIVGAQVGETSLLTRAAMTVAHAARDVLAAQEGGFGTLLLGRDVCDPPLMFGAGGVLDVSSYPFLTKPGFGLDPIGRPEA
ncbi:MAG: enolase C-terminal domain-like protein [Vicinamibacterales bacterium]